MPKSGDILCPPVLIVQIIGMLPDIEAEERRGAVAKRRVLISGRVNFERAVLQAQPDPPTAETLERQKNA